MPRSIPPDESKLKSFFTHLGFSPDQTALYHTLIKHGPLTILELSRKSGIPRTRVYRTLEIMRSQKLTEEIIDEHRTLAAAVPPDRLEKLLQTKQARVQELTKLFPEVQNYLNQQIHRRQSDTSVKFYRGLEGIKQMAENVLRAKKEIIGYTYFNWESAVGEKYTHYFFEEMARLNLTMREIFSDTYIQSKGGLQALSQSEAPPHLNHLFESRYLPKEKLDIQAQSDIYNDVVTFYSWHQEEIFGVEIYNQKIANMQRQIFNLLWKIAVPETEIHKHSPTPSTHIK